MSNYVVIGSNYGDEGKGRAVRYIKDNLTTRHVLGIKHNGGCQAGHTSYGFIHHSLCSAPIPTYLADTFIFNPFSFNKEYEEKSKTYSPNVFINEKCRITTPIDILMNHLIETIRSKDRHGSCGMGIFATKIRSQRLPMSIVTLQKMSFSQRREFTKSLIQHFYGFEQAMIEINRKIPKQFKDINLALTMDDFYEELDKSLSNSNVHLVKDEKTLFSEYEDLIFENAQGLLLDEDNEEAYPHTTPSKTDSTNPINIILKNNLNDKKTIPVYCTRTYLTKHGAGPFNHTFNEKAMEIVKKFDTTNITNDWQGSIRCDIMDNKLKERTENDFKKYIDNNINVDKPMYFISWWDTTNKKMTGQWQIPNGQIINLNEMQNNFIEDKKINYELNILSKEL